MSWAFITKKLRVVSLAFGDFFYTTLFLCIINNTLTSFCHSLGPLSLSNVLWYNWRLLIFSIRRCLSIVQPTRSQVSVTVSRCLGLISLRNFVWCHWRLVISSIRLCLSVVLPTRSRVSDTVSRCIGLTSLRNFVWCH